MAKEVSIQVIAEDGQKHPVTAPFNMNAGAFLEEVVDFLKLPAGDWVLDDKETGRELDPKTTLDGNGVHSGHALFLHLSPKGEACPVCGFENAPESKFCRRCGKPLTPPPTPENLRFRVHTPDGHSHEIDAPSGLSAQELLDDLITTPEYGIGGSTTSAEWILDDKDTGKRLDLTKSLDENGVAHGHNLYLRQLEKRQPLPYRKIMSGIAAVLLIAAAAYGAYQAVTRRVVINPANPTVKAGDQLQLKATYRGQPGAMSWTLTPEIGTISNEGLYTAPPFVAQEQKVEVRATSEQDRSKFSTTVITVKSVPVAVAVHLNHVSVTLSAGETTRFAADVTGTQDVRVTWSLVPEIGSIAPDGTYTAPAGVDSDTAVQVTAASAVEPNASATATVTLKAFTIKLSVKRSEIDEGQTVKVIAQVAGSSDSRLRWSISPSLGYISANGVYFPPAEIHESQNVTVRATSMKNPLHSATLTLRVKMVVAISLSPSGPESVGAGQSRKFTAKVSGSTNRSVQWTLSGPGNIAPDGVYTAPESIGREQSVGITATSVADPTKSSGAIVSLTPVSVAISPASAELFASQSVRFTASVAGSANTEVQWLIDSKQGTMSSQGEYVAPSFIPNNQIVRVRVRSVADPSKVALATIFLKRYTGSLSGALVFNGLIEKNELIVIEGKQIVRREVPRMKGEQVAKPVGAPSLGSVQGDALPGLPVLLSFAPENYKDFSIEQPNAVTGWRQFGIRSKKRKQGTVKITWKVVQK